MPRKKKTQAEETPARTPEVVETSLEDILADRFSRYSKYIIQERALPDARDGLKPVQRRILWAMYEDGNTYNKPYRKSAKTVGNVIGNYHPHGDSSVYDALVRLSQDWKIRWPLIDMQGNNGSIDDDPAAAMRYTEARLSKLSQTLMQDIDQDTVEWSPNFSDEKMEPTVLPSRYPNLLVNGITGIAAGYATNIPPHNLSEVIEGCIYRMKNPECSLDEMMEIIKGPDFPTGGIAMGYDGIRQAFETGRGKLFIRSKTAIEETKTLQQIVVTEIPYEVIKSNLVKRIDDIRFDKKVDGILDVRDESDRNGLRIVIDIKKEANAQAILNYLYKNTDLQISYNYNVVAIVNKAPVQMGLLAMLDAFIEFREEVVLRRSRFDYDKKSARMHIVEGLIQAISVLDEVIALIRASRNKADSKNRLMDRFGFSEAQAEAIVTLQLYRLSNTDIKELEREKAALEKDLKFLKGILENRKKRVQLMIKELMETAEEFPTPRRTALQKDLEEIVIDEKAMVAKEQVMVTISRDGYLKRVSMRSYTSGSNGGAFTGTKEGDRIVTYGEASTLDTLLLFTTRGKMGMIPVYTIPEGKWKENGTHLSSLLRLEPNEKVTAAWLMDHKPEHLHFVFATEMGMIKRLAAEDLPAQKGMRSAAVMNVASLDSMTAAAAVCHEDDQVILGTRGGFGVRYDVQQIPAASAKAKGVRAVNLQQDDTLAFMFTDDEDFVFLEMENGGMKRISSEEVPELKRPAKGSMLFKNSKANPTHICDAAPLGLHTHLEFGTDRLVSIPGKDIAKMSTAQSYSSVHKEEDGKAPVYIRKLSRLPKGEWKEEEQQQVRLFDQ